jgi:putative CocE/NonD family hydrolase
MEDGTVLRADLFRPTDDDKHPVILSYGAFGKGLAFQDGNKSAWDRMIAAFPEVAEGSTCKYQVWEVVDPEKWVPDGYACLRVDARGAGRSPGYLDPWSPLETKDIYQSIEWAAAQPWCSGKVGMNGISYFAMNQWYVAQHRPSHLAAICVWEGAARLVSRGGASRRHLLRIPGQSLSARVPPCAARIGRARIAQPGDWPVGVGAADLERRRARAQSARHRAVRARASVR